MLEMKANCEKCDEELPANSDEARICSFECTFCAVCAAVLEDVCPNCGGELVARPRRPEALWAQYSSTEQVIGGDEPPS